MPKKDDNDPDLISMIGCDTHFFDSGVFSLWKVSEEWGLEHGRNPREYFMTKQFRKFMDGYAEFVKRNRVAIDLYCNCDVIGDPDLTWENQQYLEDIHGLKPVPVVHFKTDMRWLRHYMDHGHELIALGGLVRAAKRGAYFPWLDRVFKFVGNPQGLPTVKLHGFGITNFKIMIRYPWYSLDSAAWSKRAGFGLVIVPHKRDGAFVFDEPPYQLFFTSDAPKHNTRDGRHYLSVSRAERAVVNEWLDSIDMPIGNENSPGLTNCHNTRKTANLLFFDRMQKSLPPYPWPFEPSGRRGFGLYT